MKYINILNELSEHINIQINSCSHDYHDDKWIENKVHKDYDIWYIKSGEISIDVDGNIHTASEGDIVFFYPDMPYTAYTYNRECSFIYIHFDFSIHDNYRVLDNFNLAGVIPGKIISSEAQICEKGFLSYKKNISMSSIMLKGCFTILLAKIFEYYNSDNHSKTFFPENVWRINTGCISVLQPVFNYITDNMSKPIRIKELAQVAGISEKYFINYFKNILGIPPGRYINQLKMNRARDYLYQGKYTIKEISSMLGYPDQYSFSKAFKKHYRVSPSKFVD